MGMIQFRCKAKTEDDFRTIAVNTSAKTASCNCNGFDGQICSHIDATLISGERFMVPQEDWTIADDAMEIMDERIAVPNEWRGSWRNNNVWRGLSQPRDTSARDALIDRFGADYLNRPMVCFTGTGPIKRKDLLEVARIDGWQAVNTLREDTRVLVAENPNGKSNKLKKARLLGVPILTYEEWDRLNSEGVFDA